MMFFTVYVSQVAKFVIVKTVKLNCRCVNHLVRLVQLMINHKLNHGAEPYCLLRQMDASNRLLHITLKSKTCFSFPGKIVLLTFLYPEANEIQPDAEHIEVLKRYFGHSKFRP